MLIRENKTLQTIFTREQHIFFPFGSVLNSKLHIKSIAAF